MRAVGMVGLGLLGSAIATRLLRAGWLVFGHDIDESRREWLEQHRGQAVSTFAEVAAATERIVLSLPDDSVVDSVIRGASDLLHGKLIIDTTTGDPQATANLAQWLAERGTLFVDATVVGSSQQVLANDAVVLVGGESPALEQASEVIEQFSRRWFHVDRCGSGAMAKLIVNLVLGLNRAALAEGLFLAGRCGLDPRRLLEILRDSAAYSAVMDSKGEKMLSGDFAPQARLSQHHKDVRLILRLAERVAASLPLSQLHAQLLSRAEALGLSDQDNCAILRVWESFE